MNQDCLVPLTNAQRADWAAALFKVPPYDEAMCEGEALIDMIADLCHWAQRHGFKPAHVLQTVVMHYTAEIKDEQEVRS